MTFWDNLLYNYIPLALIILGALWYFGAFKKFRKTAEQSDDTGTLHQSEEPDQNNILELPPARERLVAFARDMSGDHPGIVALASEMMRSGKVPTNTNDTWEYENFYDVGSGPENFAPVILSVLTSECLNGPPATPLVYFDWKEDLPECCDGFSRLYEKVTGDPIDIGALIEAWPDNIRFGASAPIVTASLARDLFSRAGFNLLELIPPLGWDAHLFAAVPNNRGKRWKKLALRAGSNCTRKNEVISMDAYFTAAKFIAEHRPPGVSYFEHVDPDPDINVYWYWEEKA